MYYMNSMSAFFKHKHSVMIVAVQFDNNYIFHV